MDLHVKIANQKMRAALEEYNKYKAAVQALQDICDHDWMYKGHGHNSEFYTCEKCGSTREH